MKSKTLKSSRAARPGNSVLGKGAATAFLSPSLIFIGIFLLIPAFWTLYLGLTDYKLVGIEALNPSFVGIDNFTKALLALSLICLGCRVAAMVTARPLGQTVPMITAPVASTLRMM